MRTVIKPISLKIMKPVTALLIASLLGPAITQAEANQYWTEYGANPVLIQQNNNGRVQTLKFVNFVDGMLVAELDGGVGEVSLPVSESMVATLSFEGIDMPAINRQIAQENYTAVLTELRPKAYPLIKFHEVPETFTQLHVPIRSMIDTLLMSGELDEALDVISRIDLSKVGLKYSELGVQLMNGFLNAGEFDKAAQLTAMLPVEGDYAVNIRPIIEAADLLRAAGKHNEVIPLYVEIEKVVPEELKDNIKMWLAYSLVLADRIDEATEIIDALGEPDPDAELFSLYKLLEGSRAYRGEDYSKAIDLLTRGFVRAQTSYSWVPEMLYLIGDCYARAEDPIAARNVWTEIVILYPESPWAESATSSLAELQNPEQPINN